MLQYARSDAIVELQRFQVEYDYIGGIKIVTGSWANISSSFIRRDYSMDKMWTGKAQFAGDHSVYHRNIGMGALIVPDSSERGQFIWPDPVTGDRVASMHFMDSSKNVLYSTPGTQGINSLKTRYPGSYSAYYTKVHETSNPCVFIHQIYQCVFTISPASGLLLSMARVVYPVPDGRGNAKWEMRTFSRNGSGSGKAFVNNHSSGIIAKYFGNVMSEAMAFAKTISFKPRTLPAGNGYSISVRSIGENNWDTLIDVLKNSADTCQKCITFPTRKDYGDVTAKAVDDCKYIDVNSAMYLRDLPATFGEVKEFAKLRRSYKDPRAWATCFLSTKYGTQLTWHDTKAIRDGIIKASSSLRSRKGYSVARHRGALKKLPDKGLVSNCTSRVTVKIYHSPWDSKIMDTIKTLYDWDFYPSFKNMWDFVPYSFCLDWLVGVGDFLGAIDRAMYAQYLNVRSVLKTEEVSWTMRLDSPTLRAIGLSTLTSLGVKHYRRLVCKTLDLLAPQLEWESGWRNNIHTATALIVQRIKR